jgi:hypothetical protein
MIQALMRLEKNYLDIEKIKKLIWSPKIELDKILN